MLKVGGTLALIDFTKRSDMPNHWTQQLNRWWFANDGVYFDDAHTVSLSAILSSVVATSLSAIVLSLRFTTSPILHYLTTLCSPRATRHAPRATRHHHTATPPSHTQAMLKEHPKLKTVWFAENEARVPYTPLQATHYTFAGKKMKK